MHKTLRTLSYFVVLAFVVACGGGSDTPPPPAATPAGNESLPQLYKLAQNARNACCSTFAPYMVQYGTQPNFDPNASMPNTSGCENAVREFEVAYMTIDNGAWANTQPAMDWRQNQRVATVNCVGDQMQMAGMPTDQNNFYKYMIPAMLIAKRMQQQVPQIGNVTGYVNGIQQPNGTVILPAGTTIVNTNTGATTTTTSATVLTNGGLGTNTLASSGTSSMQVFPVLPSIPPGF